MTTIWENVMIALRGRVFKKNYDSKGFTSYHKDNAGVSFCPNSLTNWLVAWEVEFFDQYKVGELTGLITSDLGSLKDVVTENTSPIYKRSTIPVFKAHGKAQASISNCANETFSAIRTARSYSGEKRQMSMFGSQILGYRTSGVTLGTHKSANEAVTRVVNNISLLALYCLGGSKVKAGELSVGVMASFIGYTFTLTFAVQGLVNTYGDLRATFAAVERINFVLSGTEIDESLAYGLE
ncbi:hypothetical protein MKW98_011802 [Papaver atlanticum]|uniref:ABC transmembrane type-1 domain-containing protein n=1 Tax=Papaver atlanticum TaxID=357466 RepID=A0AAD4XH76_9MAGN|nr:hypothetical protein MKW98_011802 [Papaver atlanticum]